MFGLMARAILISAPRDQDSRLFLKIVPIVEPEVLVDGDHDITIAEVRY